MNQIINMIIRQVMNQLIRRGVNAGFDKASQIHSNRRADDYMPSDAEQLQQQMTPQERRHMRQARQQARRQRQQMKALRKTTRF